MKDMLKNPILYYTLAPIVILLWPLVVWAVYLPKTEDNWKVEKEQYIKAQKMIEDILSLDPERLEFDGSKAGAVEFDYATVIEKIATLCKISSANYKLSSGRIITSSGQKSQNAKVNLKGVDVAKFARFLSAIQLRWAKLQCTQVKLIKKKGLPDTWDVDLEFKYYY